MKKDVNEKIIDIKMNYDQFEKGADKVISKMDDFKKKNDQASEHMKENNVFKILGKFSSMLSFNKANTEVDNFTQKMLRSEIIIGSVVANLINKAVDMGSGLAKSLTIEPVTSGLSEYELKMDSVKTIMSGTGETAEKVNDALEKLNDYSDRTIYKFSDMTNNIGKFTNNGVKLETAVGAMKGISNVAALAGASTQQAASAMYNFSQALGLGYVGRTDWKSIENAGMNPVEFKKELIKSAIELNKIKKIDEDRYQIGKKMFSLQALFQDGLQEQWLTSDALLNTLNRYADEHTELGKRAYAAANNVTKLSQVIDIAKERAQSGWSQTWEIIFGDINRARATFTPLSNMLESIIQKTSDMRNNFLKSALYEGYSKLFKDANNIKKNIDSVTKALKDYNKVVDEIIAGKYKNQPVRSDLLAKDGYNYAKAQNMVNERLGSKVRLKVTEQENEAKKETIETNEKLIKSLIKLSDTELKAQGYSDEHIKTISDLRAVIDRTGFTVDEFIDNLDKMNTRFLIISTLSKIFNIIKLNVDSMTKALGAFFKVPNAEDIFNFFAKIHKVVTNVDNLFKQNKEHLDKIYFGITSVLTLPIKMIEFTIKLVTKLVSKMLELSDSSLFRLFGSIGNVFGTFITILNDFLHNKVFKKYAENVDWLGNKIKEMRKQNDIFGTVINFLCLTMDDLSNRMKNWYNDIDGFLARHPTVIKALLILGDVFKIVKESVVRTALMIGDAFKKIPFHMASGFGIGLGDIKKYLVGLVDWFGWVVDKVKERLGIHSPSVVFFEIANNIIKGFVNGIQNGLPWIKNVFELAWTVIKDVVSGSYAILLNLFDQFRQNKINWDLILGIAGLFIAFKLISGIMDKIIHVGELFSNFIDSVNGLLDSAAAAMSRVSKAMAKKIESESMVNYAKAIAIMVGLVVLLGSTPLEKIVQGVIVLGVLSLFFIGLYALLGYVAKHNSIRIDMKSMVMIVIVIYTISRIVGSVHRLAKMSYSELIKGVGSMYLLFHIIVNLIKSLDDLNMNGSVKNIYLMASALLVMSLVIKIIHKIPLSTIVSMFIKTTMMGALLRLIAEILKDANVKGAGSLAKILGVMYLLVGLIIIMKTIKLVDVAISIIKIALMGKLLRNISNNLEGSINGKKHTLHLVGFIAAMYLLLGLIVVMKLISIQTVISSVIKIGLIGLLLVAINNTLKTKAFKINMDLVYIVASIMLLVGLIALISFISLGTIARSSIIILSVSGLLWAISEMMQKVKFKVNKDVVGLVIFIGLLIVALKHIGDVNSNVYISLAATAVIVLAVVAMSEILSRVPDSKLSLSKVASLLILLPLMGIMMFAISKLGDINVNITGLLNVIAALLVFIGMAAAINLMNKLIGDIKPEVISKIIKSLFMMSLVLGAILMIFKFINLLGGIPKINLGNLIAISIGLAAFMIALTPLAVIGHLSSQILQGLGTMGIIIGALIGALVLLGGIMKAVPVLKDLLNEGFDVIILVFKKIIEIVDVIGSGLARTVASMLDILGTALASFGEKIRIFLSGIAQSKVKPEAMAALMGLIISIIGGSFIAAVMKFFNGGKPNIFDDLAIALVSFMTKVLPFLGMLSQIKPEVGKMIDILLNAISHLISASIFAKFIDVKGNIEAVMNALPSIKSSITEFIKGFADLDNGHVQKTQIVAKILETIFNIAEKAPKAGGLNDLFTGTSQFSKFIDPNDGPLVKLKNSVLNFINAFVNDKNFANSNIEQNLNKINQLISVYDKLFSFYSQIEKSGGVQQYFTGEKTVEDLNDFVLVLITFMSAISGVFNDFQTKPEVFKDDNVAKINKLLEILKTIINFGKQIAEIDTNGGNIFNGMKSNAQRGIEFVLDQLLTIAPKVSEFMNKFNDGDKGLKDISPERINAIVSVVNLVNTISTVLKDLKGNEGDSGKDAAKIFEAYIETLINVVKKINELDTKQVEDFTNKINAILSAFKESSQLNVDALNKIAEAYKNIGETAVSKLAESIEGDNAKEKISNAVNNIVNHMNKGISEKTNDVVNKVLDLVNTAQKDMITGNNLQSLKDRGNDFVYGFAIGIENSPNWSTVRDKAHRLGVEAVKSLKAGIDSNSPSKKTRKEGINFGMGFILGMQKYTSLSKKTAKFMANGAVQALNSSLSDINTDTIGRPTIRPIVDLNEMNKAMSNTFDRQYALDIQSNLRGIDLEVTNRNQNNLNNRLINAVNKLEKRLDNINNNTYNINGVTYDDGSNITSAVNTLIQAVKVERKV